MLNLLLRHTESGLALCLASHKSQLNRGILRPWQKWMWSEKSSDCSLYEWWVVPWSTWIIFPSCRLRALTEWWYLKSSFPPKWHLNSWPRSVSGWGGGTASSEARQSQEHLCTGAEPHSWKSRGAASVQGARCTQPAFWILQLQWWQRIRLAWKNRIYIRHWEVWTSVLKWLSIASVIYSSEVFFSRLSNSGSFKLAYR
jgi:hypothetical protein